MIVTFKLIAAAVILIICGVSTSDVLAQQRTGVQKLRVIDYSGDMTMLLAAMADAYGVTIGFELEIQPPRQVRVSLSDPTLADVMNAIVQSSKRYQWGEETEGFVDVCPLAGCNPLLETRIRSFKIKDLSPTEAFDQLFNLPEVQANMTAMNLKRRAPDASYGKLSNARFSVNLESVSLRQALSKIAKESGIEIWVFRNYPNGFFSIGSVEK